MSKLLLRACFKKDLCTVRPYFSTSFKTTEFGTAFMTPAISPTTSSKRFVSNQPTTWLHDVYCDARPVLFLQDVFQNVQEFTGLSWWSSIAITVLGLRICTTLPLAIYQQYIFAKYRNLWPEIQALSEELLKETAAAAKKYELDKTRARILYNTNLKRHIEALIVRDNCHPFKTWLLAFIQIPLWFSQSLSLRNMVSMLPEYTQSTELTFLQLSQGGTLWFSNLTLPDSTWIMPILMAVINLAVIEFHSLSRSSLQVGLRTKTNWITNFFRMLTVVMVPIAASLPSCLVLSWLTSSTYGLAQVVLLQMPKVRRFCRIPITPSESETPIRNVLQNLRVRNK